MHTELGGDPDRVRITCLFQVGTFDRIEYLRRVGIYLNALVFDDPLGDPACGRNLRQIPCRYLHPCRIDGPYVPQIGPYGLSASSGKIRAALLFAQAGIAAYDRDVCLRCFS